MNHKSLQNGRPNDAKINKPHKFSSHKYINILYTNFNFGHVTEEFPLISSRSNLKIVYSDTHSAPNQP